MQNLSEHTLIYDGTFDGFLSCVFQVYDLRINQASIQRHDQIQESLFGTSETVPTNLDQADRVWNGVKKKTTSMGSLRLYYAFLSEQLHIENLLLRYMQYALRSNAPIDSDFGNEDVLKVTQIAKSVGREKHRMEAFVRFKLTKHGFYFANVEPDFNVLPLILKHFKSRYADQQWVIYDLKRNYGLYYNLENVAIIDLSMPTNFEPSKTSTDFFAEEEIKFQTLWQDYFESTNIPARKNMKLHIRHVPKRYWKYLSEKLR